MTEKVRKTIEFGKGKQYDRLKAKASERGLKIGEFIEQECQLLPKDPLLVFDSKVKLFDAMTRSLLSHNEAAVKEAWYDVLKWYKDNLMVPPNELLACGVCTEDEQAYKQTHQKGILKVQQKITNWGVTYNLWFDEPRKIENDIQHIEKYAEAKKLEFQNEYSLYCSQHFIFCGAPGCWQNTVGSLFYGRTIRLNTNHCFCRLHFLEQYYKELEDKTSPEYTDPDHYIQRKIDYHNERSDESKQLLHKDITEGKDIWLQEELEVTRLLVQREKLFHQHCEKPKYIKLDDFSINQV